MVTPYTFWALIRFPIEHLYIPGNGDHRHTKKLRKVSRTNFILFFSCLLTAPDSAISQELPKNKMFNWDFYYFTDLPTPQKGLEDGSSNNKSRNHRLIRKLTISETFIISMCKESYRWCGHSPLAVLQMCVYMCRFFQLSAYCLFFVISPYRLSASDKVILLHKKISAISWILVYRYICKIQIGACPYTCIHGMQEGTYRKPSHFSMFDPICISEDLVRKSSVSVTWEWDELSLSCGLPILTQWTTSSKKLLKDHWLTSGKDVPILVFCWYAGTLISVFAGIVIYTQSECRRMSHSQFFTRKSYTLGPLPRNRKVTRPLFFAPSHVNDQHSLG